MFEIIVKSQISLCSQWTIFFKSQTYSVKIMARVSLEITVQNCIVGMLSTCPIEMSISWISVYFMCRGHNGCHWDHMSIPSSYAHIIFSHRCWYSDKACHIYEGNNEYSIVSDSWCWERGWNFGGTLKNLFDYPPFFSTSKLTNAISFRRDEPVSQKLVLIDKQFFKVSLLLVINLDCS